MRQSCLLCLFLLFSVMLSAFQPPGVLAQVACTMSGASFLPVELRSEEASAASTTVGASSGSCQPTSAVGFTATLTGDQLELTPHGILTTCYSREPKYTLTKSGDTITLVESGNRSTGTLTRPPGTVAFNHLTMTSEEDYFDNAEAELIGNMIEGWVHLPHTSPLPTTLQFNSPIVETCTDSTTNPRRPQNYIVMTNPIPNTLDPLNPIPGPSFIVGCSPEEVFREINKIYIPVDSEWKLTFQCGSTYFGQVGNGNHSVPALSTYGMLLFCLAVFGFGIWGMRRTRFGDTLAGR